MSQSHGLSANEMACWKLVGLVSNCDEWMALWRSEIPAGWHGGASTRALNNVHHGSLAADQMPWKPHLPTALAPVTESLLSCPPLTVTKAAEGSSLCPRFAGPTFTRPMSTKKRPRPSPAADLEEAEVDDAALRLLGQLPLCCGLLRERRLDVVDLRLQVAGVPFERAHTESVCTPRSLCAYSVCFQPLAFAQEGGANS